MDFKKNIATGLTAATVGFGSNFAQSAEKEELDLFKGPASIVIPGLKKSTSSKPVVVVPNASSKQPTTGKKKVVAKDSSKVTDCKGPVDTISFSNPPRNIFGNDKVLKDCGSKEVYKSNVANLMSLNYGKNWVDSVYSVGPIATPIFTAQGKSFTEDVANKYKNSLSDTILVYKYDKDEKKVGPKAQLTGIITAALGAENKIPLVDADKETKYTFDIDGNGIGDILSVKKEGEKLVVEALEGKEVKIYTIDEARYQILKNLRFVQDSPMEAAKGYLMTQANSGAAVVRFMFDTNKHATAFPETCVVEKNENSKGLVGILNSLGMKFQNESEPSSCYIPSVHTKIATAEDLVALVDKTANLSSRADFINEKILKAMNEGKLQYDVNPESIEVLTYSNTFGEKVPMNLLALQFGLGSAIYTTLSSDFLPTIKQNELLVRARGGADAVNLKTFLDGGLTQQNANFAYNISKNMYVAQFDATKTRIEKREF